jgi:site-specific DNA-methyltransferase (adenine-specific)
MKPYYQDDWAAIYHGDCRDILPELPKVDLVLTDPPYGLGGSSTKKNKYSTYVDDRVHLLPLIEEVIAPLSDLDAVMALTPGVANIAIYPPPTWILCWTTPSGAGSGPWGFCCWQPVLVYGPDPFLKSGKGRRPDLIQHTETAEKNGHPCPKPVGAWRKIAQRVYPEGDGPILDPFMGSGTTLRAAKDLNRKSIGIEIEEKYCEIAANRLAQEVMDFT